MKNRTSCVLLLIVVAACQDAPTAPKVVPTSGDVAFPAAGPMSSQGPVANGMSVSTPDASVISVESPRAIADGTAMQTESAGAVPGGGANSHAFGFAEAAIATIPPNPGLVMRLLWQNTSTGDRSIWFLDGPTWNGTSYALLPTVATAWSIAATGDFNGDGYQDIVWQNTVTGDRSIWYMINETWNGDFALLPNVAPAWSIAGAGDFNGDGKPDLVWQNTTTGDRSIWFMNGSTWGGTFALLPNVAPAWRIAAVADFDGGGTGSPDLVWQNLTTGQRSIWFMTGSTWGGTFALLPTVSTDWRIAGAADLDGDIDSDIVWQNIVTGQRSVWLMTGSTWGGSYSLLPTVATAWSIAGTLKPKASAVTRIKLMPFPAIVDMGTTLPTSVTAYSTVDGFESVVGTPEITYTSRDLSIATINASGVVTGVALGQTILVAAVTGNPSIADSVVAVVTAVGAPAIYTDIDKFSFLSGSTMVVKVFLDMRNSGKTLGSTKIAVLFTSRAMTFSNWTATGPSVSPQVNLANVGIGVFVFAMADGTGISGKVELLQLTFFKQGADGTLSLTQAETNAGDFTSLTSQTAGITYQIGTR